MQHTMRTPCESCPFRTDVAAFLRAERVREIAASVLRGSSFPCHKTTSFEEDDEGDTFVVPGPGEVQCAGAEIFLAHQGQSTQMARIAERLGQRVATLDMAAPVFRSAGEMERAQDDYEEPEGDPCSVVNMGCEAPAGILIGGGVIDGTEAAGFTCCSCYEPVCGSCSRETADGRECGRCAEEES